MDILAEPMRILMEITVNLNDDGECLEGINKLIWQRCICSAK